jgi:hypothetical protein
MIVAAISIASRLMAICLLQVSLECVASAHISATLDLSFRDSAGVLWRRDRVGRLEEVLEGQACRRGS